MSDSEKSQELVFRQSGDSEWLILPAITNAIPEFKGKIVCDAEAYAHVWKRHSKDLLRFGYSNAESFVQNVLQNAEAVYSAPRQHNNVPTYDIVARAPDANKRVLVYLKIGTSEDSVYDVATAGVVRKNMFNKRSLLWGTAQSIQPT